MSDFDLPQLEALAAVVDEGSFDAAARRLHVTPSAVSQRIKLFETAAGTVLLRRSKPVEITSAGVPYLRLARQVRALVAEIAVSSGDSGVISVPIAVNGDSLNTWVLPALAALGDWMVFDIRREDQDHSTRLLRQGIVMGAVTTSSEPVQGCSVTRLGVMRYRPMCTPTFLARWFASGVTADALSRAPMLVFDRSDDLQDRYRMTWGASERHDRTHYVPSSADFAEAVRLGLGWAMLPRQQSEHLESMGELIELAPGTGVDVTLYWQQWSVHTKALAELSSALLGAASAALD